MRRNTFIKSMLRQPIRTAVIIILMAATAFAFVMRSAEYFVVKDQIESIGKFYRSIGYLQNSGGRSIYNDVSTGAQYLTNSKHIEFTDERRAAVGYLHDITNSRFGGGQPEYNFRTRHHTDAYLYGELIDKGWLEPSYVTLNPFVWVRYRVDEVLECSYGTIAPGDEIELRYYLTDDERVDDLAAKWHNYLNDDNTSIITPADEMIIGHRYFIRCNYGNGSLMALNANTTWYIESELQANINDDTSLLQIANQIETNDDSTSIAVRGDDIQITREDLLRRLARLGSTRARNSTDIFQRNVLQLPANPIWYIEMDEGEAIDSAEPGYEWLDRELKLMTRSQHAVQLLTTSDMTAMPVTQPQNRIMQLIEGRWLDRSDEQNANSVGVINEYFAYRFDLNIGDVLRINVPDEQHAVSVYSISSSGRIFTEYQLDSPPSEDRGVDLEIEIVGIYGFRLVPGLRGGTADLSSTFIYIPDSCLPQNLETRSVNTDLDNMGWIDGQEYLPQYRYSFVLSDAREADAFHAINEQELEALGYDLMLIDTGAVNFWKSANPIIQAVTLNVVVFSILLVLVTTAVMFLYMRQRRKDFAIARAMGNPSKIVITHLVLSVVLFGLPTVIVSSAAGWYFASGQIDNTLNPFGELATTFNFTISRSVPIYLLFILTAIVFLLFALVTIIVARMISRLSVLELLQGGSNQPIPSKSETALQSREVSSRTVPAMRQSHVLSMKIAPQTDSHPSIKSRLDTSIRFVSRHITRAAVRSFLIIAVAFVFIMALGWMNGAIDSAKSEIERLYDTTIVTADLRPTNNGQASPLHNIGDLIRPRVVEDIMATGYVMDVYYEAGHSWAAVVPTADDGTFPENWADIIGYDHGFSIAGDPNQQFTNALMGVSDVARFVEENTGMRMYSENDPIGDIDIEYMAGFGDSDFMYTEGRPIPVIISERLLISRNLSLGKNAYIYCNKPFISMTGSVVTGRWNSFEIIIVGVHNSSIRQSYMRNSVIMPVEALEFMVGADLGYITIRFAIDPAYNRDLLNVRETIRRASEDPSQFLGWGVLLGLQINDEELRTVVGSMEQNLALLQKLYPITITISIIIGLGLSLLLMLQNAKNAAIMRVLGTTKSRSGYVLCAEQLAVCISGLILSIIALVLLRWTDNINDCIILALLYLAGVLAGSGVGAILVTNRPPLLLLQVKE